MITEIQLYCYIFLGIGTTSQQTFQRCFNIDFWLIRRRDVGQLQINVETTFQTEYTKYKVLTTIS